MGVVLSFSLATGLVLGGNGHMSEALDTKLTQAANSYVFNKQAGCGFDNGAWLAGNTCLEDHAIAALGLHAQRQRELHRSQDPRL